MRCPTESRPAALLAGAIGDWGRGATPAGLLRSRRTSKLTQARKDLCRYPGPVVAPFLMVGHMVFQSVKNAQTGRKAGASLIAGS